MRAGGSPMALFQRGPSGIDSPYDLSSGMTAIVWVDLSDASRLFTDNAGSSPVVSDGDRIRLAKAQPGFTVGLENWRAGTGGSTAVDTDRPYYRTNVVNGKDAVDFDTGLGDGDLNLQNNGVGSHLTDSDIVTIGAVFKMPASDTTDQKSCFGSSNGNNTQFNFRKSNDSPNPSGFRIQSHSGSTQTDDSTSTLPAAGNWIHIILVINKNDTTSKARCYWNTVEDTNFTHNPTDAQLGVSGMFIGQRTPAGSTADADGLDEHMTEFYVLDGAASSADRQELHDFFEAKYGTMSATTS